MKTYKPNPVDTNDVKLNKELLELMEVIAEHVHDIWSQARLAEGWKFGTKKDSTNKTTPLLVPYNQLPESEKEFDRSSALETVKLLIKLNFTIEKNISRFGTQVINLSFITCVYFQRDLDNYCRIVHMILLGERS